MKIKNLTKWLNVNKDTDALLMAYAEQLEVISDRHKNGEITYDEMVVLQDRAEIDLDLKVNKTIWGKKQYE